MAIELIVNLSGGIDETDLPDIDDETEMWKVVLHWGTYNPSHPYRLGDGALVGGEQIEFKNIRMGTLKWILFRDWTYSSYDDSTLEHTADDILPYSSSRDQIQTDL